MKITKKERIPKCFGYCKYNDPDRGVAIVKTEDVAGGYIIITQCPNIDCRTISEWRKKEEIPTYEKLIELESVNKRIPGRTNVCHI